MSDYKYDNIKLSEDFNSFSEQTKELIKIASINLSYLNSNFESKDEVYYDGQRFFEISGFENSEYFAEILANIIRFKLQDEYTEKMFIKYHRENISVEFEYLENKIKSHNELTLQEKEQYLNPRVNRFFKTYKNSYCPLELNLDYNTEKDYSFISDHYVNELNKIQNDCKFFI